LLTGIIAAAIIFFSRNSGAAQYVTARIDRGDIDSTVTTTGNLNAVITVQVGSQVSGNIIALYADFNTKVKKGQLVAEIDPAPFKAVVDQATATLDAAKAAVVTEEATLAQSQATWPARRPTSPTRRRTCKGAERRRIWQRSRTTGVRSWSRPAALRRRMPIPQANYDQAVASVDASTGCDQCRTGFRRLGTERGGSGSHPARPGQSRCRGR
jgi:multidrug resistance efflux pump